MGEVIFIVVALLMVVVCMAYLCLAKVESPYDTWRNKATMEALDRARTSGKSIDFSVDRHGVVFYKGTAYPDGRVETHLMRAL